MSEHVDFQKVVIGLKGYFATALCAKKTSCEQRHSNENISLLIAADFLVFGEFPKIWTWLGALTNFGAARDAMQHGLGSFAKSVSS